MIQVLVLSTIDDSFYKVSLKKEDIVEAIKQYVNNSIYIKGQKPFFIGDHKEGEGWLSSQEFEQFCENKSPEEIVPHIQSLHLRTFNLEE